MKYQVTSTINDDVEVLDSIDKVDEYISSELKLANVYETKNPYTREDFTIKPTTNS